MVKKIRMNKFRQKVIGLAAVAALVLWTLTAPGWFASGRVGRALTELDIWAQIHLPYPVLTLLLAGIAVSALTVRLLRARDDEHGVWNARR
jgi:hypothetical protein